MSTRKTDRRVHALAGFLAVVLAVGLTWPAALRPTSVLVGHPGNDNWNHVWGYWWVAQELAAGRLPSHTDLLAFPDGGTLVFIDLVHAVLVTPVTLLLGAAAAYNLANILGLALGGWGAWLLAREVSGDHRAAFFALVYYGTAPQLLAQVYNGVSEAVGAGWLPLSLWALLRLLRAPSGPRVVVLALLGALCLSAGFYFGLLLILAGVVLVGAGLLQASDAARRWAQLRALLQAGVLCLLLGLPVIVVFLLSLDAGDGLVQREADAVMVDIFQHNRTDLRAIFWPAREPSPNLLEEFEEHLRIVVYLGWSGLLLALAAGRGRALWAWWVVIIVCLVLGLGPCLFWAGDHVQIGESYLSLPFLSLRRTLPLFDRLSHPFRLLMGCQLALAVLASIGLARLIAQRPPRIQRGLVVGASLLCGLEVILCSPTVLPVPTSDASIPTAYTDLRADPAPGAVLDLPIAVPMLERGIYTWYQTEHQRPVPWRPNILLPDPLVANAFTHVLISLELGRAWRPSTAVSALKTGLGLSRLREQGYRYLVLHAQLMPPRKLRQVRLVLDAMLPPPRWYPEDELWVYSLEDQDAAGTLETPAVEVPSDVE